LVFSGAVAPSVTRLVLSWPGGSKAEVLNGGYFGDIVITPQAASRGHLQPSVYYTVSAYDPQHRRVASVILAGDAVPDQDVFSTAD
jgi:hypothetical protein